MLEILNIVKGSVSAKDMVPVLTHFALHEGRLCGYDGRVYIDAPYAYADRHSFTVPAIEFIAAMEVCEGQSSVFSVGDGFLNITSGQFKARLPIGPMENFPSIEPEGKRVKHSGGLLESFRKLRPFIGEDASRPWSSGIIIKGARAIATNNIVIAEVPLTLALADCIIPVFAIEELLRLDLEPLAYSQTPEAITFYLPGDIWLRTKLVAGEVPASLPTIVKELHKGAKWTDVPPDLADAVSRVRPFCAHKAAPLVKLFESRVSTECETMAATVGGFPDLGAGMWRCEPLLAVLGHATKIDWSKFPRVPWKGANIKGAIVGSVV